MTVKKIQRISYPTSDGEENSVDKEKDGEEEDMCEKCEKKKRS